jgi:hypothetical protein
LLNNPKGEMMAGHPSPDEFILFLLNRDPVMTNYCTLDYTSESDKFHGLFIQTSSPSIILMFYNNLEGNHSDCHSFENEGQVPDKK